MINYKTVGERIKHAREKAGMTQGELATAVGYTSPTAVSLIEANERSIKVDTLHRIAELLHQDYQYLATGSAASVSTVKTALRADSSFDKDDISQIENFIDYLAAQKKDKDGRERAKEQRR